MNPIDFDDSNAVLTKPAGMTDEECGALAVYRYDQGVVSCWKPSIRERLSLLIFGRLWLHVCTRSRTHPPIALLGTKHYFVRLPEDKNLSRLEDFDCA